MAGTILFNNSRVAEPTVALWKNAGERKDQFALTAVVAMLSVFFIALFITVGFFLPRGHPLSTTGDNRKSELYDKVSVEADEGFIQWHGKGDATNEWHKPLVTVKKVDVDLKVKVPVKSETNLATNEWHKPLVNLKNVDVGLAKEVPVKSETHLPNEWHKPLVNVKNVDVGLAKEVPVKSETHFSDEWHKPLVNLKNVDVGLAKEVPAKSETHLSDEWSKPLVNVKNVDVGLAKEVPVKSETHLPHEVQYNRPSIYKVDVATVTSVGTVSVKTEPHTIDLVTSEPRLVYKTVPRKPCILYGYSGDMFGFPRHIRSMCNRITRKIVKVVSVNTTN